MVKSKVKIEKQIGKKTNKDLVDTVIFAKKNKEWLRVAEILSEPKRVRKSFNIGEINNKMDSEKIVVAPGKVLSEGNLNKKVKVVALSFSEKAKDKILKSGSQIANIIDEIKINPDAKGVLILN